MLPIISQLGSPASFLEQLFTYIQQTGIDSTQLYLDHICYRVATVERYESLKAVLAPHAQLLSETIIGERPIASYLLHEPFRYKDRSINCLELPAPKAGSPYPEGYEHVEFVIKESFESFMEKYPEVPFKSKGMDKAVNADIAIGFNGMSVKFHHHPLPYVIAYLD